MKSWVYLTLVLSLLILDGCKMSRFVSDEYQPYEHPVPDTFRFSLYDTLDPVEGNWRNVIKDTILLSHIETALTNNRELDAGIATLSGLFHLYKVERSALYPQVNAKIYGEREVTNREENGISTTSGENEYDVVLSASWMPDIWGRTRMLAELAEADFKIAIADYRGIHIIILASVLENYIELLHLDYQLAITEKNIEILQEALRLIDLRYRGGLSTELEFLQAKVALQNQQLRIPLLEERIAVSEHALKLLMGEFPGYVPRSHLDSVNLDVTVRQGVPSYLLKNRPDIISSAYNLEASSTSIGIAITNFLPSIMITGDLGFNEVHIENVLGSPYWFASGTLLNPIFQAGANKRKLKASKASFEQASADYSQTVLNAFREVNDAVIGVEKNIETRELNEELLVSSEKLFELSKLQYINGAVSYLQVLDAQRTYFNSRIDLGLTKRNQLLAMINLFVSVGGGWTEQDAQSMSDRVSELGYR